MITELTLLGELFLFLRFFKVWRTPTFCSIQYIPYYLRVSAVLCESSFPCSWTAGGRTTSCWLIGRAPLAWGCFLWAPHRGPHGPLANDVTVNDHPPAACQVHWGKRATRASETFTMSRAANSLLIVENIHCFVKPQWLLLRLPGVAQGFGHQFFHTSSVILVGARLLCRATILNVLQVPSRLF